MFNLAVVNSSIYLALELLSFINVATLVVRIIPYSFHLVQTLFVSFVQSYLHILYIISAAVNLNPIMTGPPVKVPFLNCQKYLDPSRCQSYEQVPTTHRKSESIFMIFSTQKMIYLSKTIFIAKLDQMMNIF